MSSPTSLIGLDKDLWTLETSSQDRKRYDTILEQVLTQLEPVFMQEQQFCVKFFQVCLEVSVFSMYFFAIFIKSLNYHISFKCKLSSAYENIFSQTQ